MKKTYHGSCHCGAVKFAAELDLSKGTGKCNCSICTKTGAWNVSIKPHEFKLLQGESNLADYQFNTNSVHHLFCKTCGVRCFGRGDIPEMGGAFVSISLRALDDASVDELLQAPVHYSNGRDNAWERAPAETRHL